MRFHAVQTTAEAEFGRKIAWGVVGQSGDMAGDGLGHAGWQVHSGRPQRGGVSTQPGDTDREALGIEPQRWWALITGLQRAWEEPGLQGEPGLLIEKAAHVRYDLRNASVSVYSSTAQLSSYWKISQEHLAF